MAIRATRSPDNHDQLAIEKTVRLKSGFAVVPSVIQQCKRQAREYFAAILKIQASLGQRLRSFCGVIGDPHLFYMPTQNRRVNKRLNDATGSRYGADVAAQRTFKFERWRAKPERRRRIGNCASIRRRAGRSTPHRYAQCCLFFRHEPVGLNDG